LFGYNLGFAEIFYSQLYDVIATTAYSNMNFVFEKPYLQRYRFFTQICTVDSNLVLHKYQAVDAVALW